MPEEDPSLSKLIKSVLIPIDVDVFVRTLRHLREEAKSTSWLQLLYRLEGVSILVLIPSTLIFGLLLAYQRGVNIAQIQTLGVQYAIGLFLLSLILLAKVVIWLVKKINRGDSIWDISRESLNPFIILKTIGSSLFIIAPTYLIIQIELALETLIVLFILSFIVLFSVVAGVSGIFSTIIVLQDYISK